MRDKPATIRVAAVQYELRRIDSYEAFSERVTWFVKVASENRCDFILFPELFTLQLLSSHKPPVLPDACILKLSEYTPRLEQLFSDLATRYAINIVAGSHPTRTPEGLIENRSFLCLRDGSMQVQSKLHITPNEQAGWATQGGQSLKPFETDRGPVGILICYDSEFPEAARHLTEQGVRILFVPFCTDDRNGYLRVRYACQARAVENQCYVVMAGTVGELAGVHNMDVSYAQSCVLSPCDHMFFPDGVAVEAPLNIETIIYADLEMDALEEARTHGTVLNLKDRRQDLYRLEWLK